MRFKEATRLAAVRHLTVSLGAPTTSFQQIKLLHKDFPNQAISSTGSLTQSHSINQINQASIATEIIYNHFHKHSFTWKTTVKLMLNMTLNGNIVFTVNQNDTEKSTFSSLTFSHISKHLP